MLSKDEQIALVGLLIKVGEERLDQLIKERHLDDADIATLSKTLDEDTLSTALMTIIKSVISEDVMSILAMKTTLDKAEEKMNYC